MQTGEFYTLVSRAGLEVTLSSLGACIVSVKAPDRNGFAEEVTLGFDTPEEYLNNPMSFGLTIGRVANRIGGSRFTLDGVTYNLPANEGPNHIHGGTDGFSMRLWSAEREQNTVEFTLRSPDGDMGYPGNLTVRAKYTLTGTALDLAITATTDAPTVVNMTNHAYWNLSGFRRDVLSHELQVDADSFTVNAPNLIPTGEIRSVDGTALDFRTPRAIGERIDDPSVRMYGGYDNNLVLNGSGFRRAAVVRDNDTGRTLTLFTDRRSLQIYTGNGISPTRGHGGVTYSRHSGLALEPQSPPDAPNRPEFPSIVLRPGETYRHHSRFEFGCE
ncbi:MAG: galactose mutarotase [Oscillospiraceae bacterium]|jgi:aldose 1-epimerase|nr:galactose mutarotase [Oscillospiraceae bacterium]